MPARLTCGIPHDVGRRRNRAVEDGLHPFAVAATAKQKSIFEVQARWNAA